MPDSLSARASVLFDQSKQPHDGVYITGPSQIEVRTDTLPESAYGEDHVIIASFGNCRCASDQKAIKQFHGHARVPNDADQVALGHETVQVVVHAPAGSGINVGDLVFVTPGHSATPVDPGTFQVDHQSGILPSLGYSYRYLGGLRQFNAVPVSAISFVREQGFGNLFNVVPPHPGFSLASLAHAEPFACNYGTNKFIFRQDAQSEAFLYGVPPQANVAYLGGTARMAMINLTIVAAVPDTELPQVISITGSQRKLDELSDFALIENLRAKGTIVELIDRNADDIVERLIAHGKPEVIWTNFAAQEVYDQAVAAIAPGGNINNYAGASDPDLTLAMDVAPAPSYKSVDQEAAEHIRAMHHNESPNDPKRYRGIARDGVVRFIGFDQARADAYCKLLPQETTVVGLGNLVDPDQHPHLRFVEDHERCTDVFIAGIGGEAAERYREAELKLARSAAVNMVDGNCTVRIRSRHSHYTTRHNLCGPNVPWTMTNTSEPHADDMALHAANPIDFDWMVRGVCGLRHAPHMMAEVERTQPFGSYYTFTELPDLPFVAINAGAFAAAAAETAEGPVKAALEAGGQWLREHGDTYGRGLEEVLYAAYGVPYPLALHEAGATV